MASPTLDGTTRDPDRLGVDDEPTDPPGRPPRAGVPRLAVWAWRQLTSMRVALVLLFLLALASVPGSVFPQQRTDPVAVAAYAEAHPDLAPWLDRLSLFDVYGAPWFGAIYLLLFVSLVGCVVPRSVAHARALRSRPPAAPRNLGRLRDARSFRTTEDPQSVLAAVRSDLRRRRYRVDVTADTVAAERGFLRESGNLIFHLALLAVLVGAAVGGLFGVRGTVLVVEGQQFSNVITQYDDLSPGTLVDATDLPPFTLELVDFTATFEPDGPRRGQADEFVALVRYRPEPGEPTRTRDIRVNGPLTIGSTDVHLLGHGYAPRFTVTDGSGEVVFAGAVPFLPQDGNFTSTGVVKVPAAMPEQLGFNAFFLPTATVGQRGPTSAFPAALNPAVVVQAWRGDLGLSSGVPQSVYRLDTTDLEQVVGPDGEPVASLLAEGESLELPDGLGTITYDGYGEWVNLQVSSNPGLPVLLAGGGLALVSVAFSLFLGRRRLWLRVAGDGAGGTVGELAGLERGHGGNLDEELDRLVALVEGAPKPAALNAAVPHDGSTDPRGAPGR